MKTVEQLGIAAKKAAAVLASASSEQKNKLLLLAADMLIENEAELIAENEKDIQAGKAAGLTKSLIDRLRLTNGRIADMAKGLKEIAAETDPVGEIVEGITRPNGIRISKIRVPLGVVGIIYEARPNVTADAFGICIKAGNAVILRGGKEAIFSNLAIMKVLKSAVEAVGLPEGTVDLVEDTSRSSATELMKLKYLDLLIPRGGASLIRATVENATVPVIETGVGNCHAFVDETADLNMAVNIVENAKCQRPSVCNALETLLVHKNIAQKVLPLINEALLRHNTEVRGCERTCAILKNAVPVTDDDYATEFLDYVLAVRVVDSLDDAMEHIRKYSTGHSECIITESYKNAEIFVNGLDAAALYVNASTRFTDGGQFGMGAEIGISTGKLHARGPMGIKDLTTVKFVIRGDGQTRGV
ncbi:MAG: glutamate-5-semialdehyde dehydrogenase [Ruminococcaceae bacterium]|nr:glutamate-5-semialdehyde dehydrogenase [Oscillospiraceae bacterium]